MLDEPKCYTRNCKYFKGVKWLGREESSEVPFCQAFPRGIPATIAYGDNLHLGPYPGDHGIRYAPKEQ